ncbi:MAG: alpha/beta hydrolase, partial [Bacteroidetes bacterium]
PEEKIISFGRSLGCTFATYVATKNTPKHLILETPFYSLKSIVQSKFPILPSRLLLRFKFPTHQFIHEVNSPIHFFHGTDDFVVPYENGKALFDLAPNATLTTIFNGGHNDLADFELYWDEMGKLLR